MCFHNRIGRTRFFAEAAEDAFGQVDVVTLGAARTVFAFFRFDVNRHCRTHRLAQFTRDAAFLAVRITPLRVQTAETHRLRRFLFGEINRVFAGEKVFERYAHAFYQLAKQKGFN